MLTADVAVRQQVLALRRAQALQLASKLLTIAAEAHRVGRIVLAEQVRNIARDVADDACPD